MSGPVMVEIKEVDKDKDKEKKKVNVPQIICILITVVIVGVLFYAVSAMNSSYRGYYRYDKLAKEEWDPYAVE